MVGGVPLINGVAYAHADITLEIFGVPIIGLTAIEYGDAQDITPNYSTGQLPTSVGFGAIKFSAKLTLTTEAVQAIQRVAPGGRLQNIQFFNIGVNFLPDSGVLVRHALKACRFMGRQLSSAVNGSQIEESLDIFVADIDYNNA